MLDTLKYAQRIESELGIERSKADLAAFIARDVLQEETRDLATKQDLELALRHQLIVIGGMLSVAVGLMVTLVKMLP